MVEDLSTLAFWEIQGFSTKPQQVVNLLQSEQQPSIAVAAVVVFFGGGRISLRAEFQERKQRSDVDYDHIESMDVERLPPQAACSCRWQEECGTLWRFAIMANSLFEFLDFKNCLGRSF